jgi:ParB-like chromosome segregation protein Spo0J
MPRKLPKGEIKIGFEYATIDLSLDRIIPIKIVAPVIRNSQKYQQILASIREVGIVEPPAVTPDKQAKGRYILLDGHLRIEALKEIGEKQVTCLLSAD